ncbi:MAG: DinB family protein [Bacteroidota bacterium]
MQTYPNTPVDNPQSKTEILTELNKAFDTLARTAGTIDSTAFAQPPHPEKWSASGHFEHIVLANAASATALKQPPAFFAAFGGSLERPPLNYQQLRMAYQERSKQTVLRPSPKYAPKPGISLPLDELLDNWRTVQEKLNTRLKNWDQNSLESAILPHPAVGLMSMKELLLFTIYHTWHHLDGMEKAARGEYFIPE